MKKVFSLEEAKNFIRGNQDKRFILVTAMDRSGRVTGLLKSPKDWMEEISQDDEVQSRFSIVGLEFTEGIQDCQGGYWSKEEDGQD